MSKKRAIKNIVAGRVVESKDGYVPSCIPGSYGDYVEFDIDEAGTVAGWKRYCTEGHVRESFFNEEASE
jgi:hypothetical protein